MVARGGSGHRNGPAVGSTELRAIAEATGDVAWELDVATGMMWKSATWHTLLGYPEDDGNIAGEAWFDLIHPRDQPGIRASFIQWLMGGPPRWSGRYRLRRADGTYAHVFSRGHATRDADGRATRIIGTLTDITPLREAEEHLQERERQLAEAQEVARVASWEYQVASGSMRWSRELYRIYGVDEDYCTDFDHALRDLVPVEDQANVRSAIEQILKKGSAGAEWRIVRPNDGETRYIWGRGRLIHDEAGRPLRIVGIIQDVTEQELARKELLEARRVANAQERLSTLGTMLAGVAHEINNPLSYIRGNGEICQMTLADLAERTDLPPGLKDELLQMQAQLTSLQKGVEQIAHVTTSLKQVARSGASSARQNTRLDAVVRDALDLVSTSLPLDIALRRELEFDGEVEASASELAQVVLNLVLNAGDAVQGRPDATIVIRTYRRDGRAVIEVEDNGRGISDESKKKLFTPFFTTKTEGTGLGLSVSHRIVADHGGVMSFQSTVGAGTCFQIDLPTLAPRPPGDASTPENA